MGEIDRETKRRRQRGGEKRERWREARETEGERERRREGMRESLLGL